MQYATVQDMIDRFGQAELVQLTDPQLLAVQAPKAQRALDDAQHLADAYVGQVYALPLAGCSKPAPVPGNVHAQSQVPPPLLTRLVCDVARYYLYDHLAPEHEVALRFNAAQKALERIAQGRAVLTCPWGGQPGHLLAGTEPGAGEVLYAFSQRSVRDEDLRGYA